MDFTLNVTSKPVSGQKSNSVSFFFILIQEFFFMKINFSLTIVDLRKKTINKMIFHLILQVMIKLKQLLLVKELFQVLEVVEVVLFLKNKFLKIYKNREWN